MDSGKENWEWVEKKKKKADVKIKLLLFTLLPRDMASSV